MNIFKFQSKKWTVYLTRPFNLFLASLWFDWYFNKTAKDLYGSVIENALIIEDGINSARQYRIKNQMDQFDKAIIQLIKNDPLKCKNALYKGLELNDRARELIADKVSFGYKETIEFCSDLIILSSALPFFVIQFSDPTSEIYKLSEKLRKETLALEYIKKIAEPVFKKQIREIFTQLNDNTLDLMTFKELATPEKINLEERINFRKKGNKFILEYENGIENIAWSDNTTRIIQKLDSYSSSDIIKGQTAYSGLVRGKVRILLDVSKEYEFDEGDILVAVNSNPGYMPYIRRCAAIIADEGGIGCHAAIISRELKKPCIIGTRIATKVLKDGDMVEVDADKGVVRKI